MTVALAGRAPATFEIKSANLPLVSLLLKSPDLGEIGAELQARFGDIPDFFDNDPLVIDLSPLQAQPEAAVDIAALVALLRRYRVVPVAARGGHPSQLQAALAAGLAAAPEAMAAPSALARRAATAPAPAAVPSVAAEPTLTSALVIDRPLRSGQQIYARGRDLVVLSMVNAGAEVVADGHIHVYAPLRGKAIAGARGNAEARIFALEMDAELISIAGIYRTSEVPLPEAVRQCAAQVRLLSGPDGDKLVIDALSA